MSSLINVNFNDIYLAKIVTFSNNDLLFNYDIDLSFNSEEYVLVIIQDNWAYDIKKYCRYRIIDYMDIINNDKLYPNIKYAYKMYPILDIYDNLKSYFVNEDKFKEILTTNAAICFQLHDIITENSKIIDLAKIKKILKDRKF